jgi:ABC-2 type transport system ATP-binding protein
MGAGAPVVRVRSVWKSYGDVAALRDVSCEVRTGTVMCLVGQNGAGKSTLLSLVVGLQPPDRGTVEVGGRNPFQWGPSSRALIGFAPQELAVYAGLTVRQNLDFYCDVYRHRGRRRREVLDRAIDGMVLRHVLDRKVRLLSGGEKRRLHTAMALVAEAPLLVLDEPTVGADPSSRSRLLEIVRARAADGAAVIYSTHYLREVEVLDGDIMILHEGRLIASGRIAELITRYGEKRVELTFRDAVPEALRGLGRCLDTRRIEIAAQDMGGDLLVAVLARLDQVELRRLEQVLMQPSNLDDVFAYLTAGTPAMRGTGFDG